MRQSLERLSCIVAIDKGSMLVFHSWCITIYLVWLLLLFLLFFHLCFRLLIELWYFHNGLCSRTMRCTQKSFGCSWINALFHVFGLILKTHYINVPSGWCHLVAEECICIDIGAFLWLWCWHRTSIDVYLTSFFFLLLYLKASWRPITFLAHS